MALSLSLVPATAAAACSSSTSLFLRPMVMSSRRRPRPPPHRMRVVAMADLLGDLGARDPFPEEIESNFGEKVLGNVDTLHQILIPTLSALSLARLPLQPDAEPLSLDDARRLLFKVVGWRLSCRRAGGAAPLAAAVRLEGARRALRQGAHRQDQRALDDGAGHAPAALVLEEEEAPDQESSTSR
ncbi:hypothetical protein BS78_K277900 [Paspalum vaginatum]|uniref:Uncharacterized protein n=1 Tax=Paspalum vaginatum TaxID=158149 RepID=A0A9W7XAY1_9POAL|nr:hypothetical protein BS78_K277900 [Paspalum vaginatum]